MSRARSPQGVSSLSKSMPPEAQIIILVLYSSFYNMFKGPLKISGSLYASALSCGEAVVLVNVAEHVRKSESRVSQSERETAANENSRRFPRVVQPTETVISKHAL